MSSLDARITRARVGGLPGRTAAAYAALFVIAFVVYTRLWPNAPVLAQDSGTYMSVAKDLADFRLDELHDRTPGFPLLLALTGSADAPQRSLFLVSLVLHFASIWVLAAVLWSFGSTQVAVLLFGVVMLLPPYMEWAGYVLTEGLAEVMLAMSVGLLALWWHRGGLMWIIAAAAVVGCSAVVRPSYQALGVAIAAAILLSRLIFGSRGRAERQPIRAAAIFGIVSCAIVVGYAALNYRAFQYFGLSPMSPLSLSTRTSNVVERLPDEYAAVREVLVKARNASLLEETAHAGHYYIWRADLAPELSRATGLHGFELNAYMSRLNMLLIRMAPLTYVTEVTRAFSAFWLPATTPLANFDSKSLQLVWAALHFGVIGTWAITLLVTAGGAVFIVMSQRLRGSLRADRLTRLNEMEPLVFVGILVTAIVLYVAAISSMAESGDPRFRVPTDALIVMMCFCGVDLGYRLVLDLRTVFDAAARYAGVP